MLVKSVPHLTAGTAGVTAGVAAGTTGVAGVAADSACF
jgi:hypothetical protein